MTSTSRSRIEIIIILVVFWGFNPVCGSMSVIQGSGRQNKDPCEGEGKPLSRKMDGLE